MLRKYWRHLLATLGGLAALAGILWAAAYGYHQFDEATKDPYTAEGYQPARDARLPQPRPKQQPQPRAYQPNCQQPQTHADADLCAQWGSVKAVSETNRLTRLALNLATLGFMFAVFGALVGIIGTVLIWLAWKETRKANVINQASTKIEQRAWVKFEIEARHGPRAYPDGEKRFAFKGKLANIGNTPARDASYYACLCFEDPDGFFPHFVETTKRDGFKWGGTPILPGDDHLLSFTANIEEDERLKAGPANALIANGSLVFVAMIVRYRTVHDDQWHHTAGLYRLVPIIGDSDVINFSRFYGEGDMRLKRYREGLGYVD